MVSDVMSAKEAAKYLEVTTRRIWQMLDSGVLHAVSDEPVLLSRVNVEHFAHVQPRSPGRPVTASKAWDEISAFRLDDFANDAELDSWRRKMRPRADWRRFHVHRSVLRDLVESRLLVASGLRAAAFHDVPVEPDEKRFVGYVAASDLDQIPTGVPIKNGNTWNLELGVVADDSWRFGRSASFVDPVTTWLDLEDHRHRSARLMLEVVLGSRD